MSPTAQEGLSSFSDFLSRLKRAQEEMKSKDATAKQNGELVGRYIREQVADGYAFYEIIKVNKTTVQIKWLEEASTCGDYIVPMWGTQATISRNYAEQSMKQIEALARIFGGV